MGSIDADAHVIETTQTFEYMDEAYKKYRPMVVQMVDGNTVLSGRILDRAELQGILAQADSLGFELVSVNPIEADGVASQDATE